MNNSEPMRAAWDRHANAYDELLTPVAVQVAEDALGIVGVGPNMRLLDIAAGGGALSIPAALRGAHVLATDWSPVMVEAITEKAKREHLTNLDAQVMDGTALGLEDGEFDMTCSQWGIMLFPDRRQGLMEMARVTKKGGTGMMVVLGPVEAVQPVDFFLQALRQAIPELTPPQNLPLFSLQNPSDLKREMEEAGFHDVQVETLEHRMEVLTANQLWMTMQSAAPPIAMLLQQLSEQQQNEVHKALGDQVQAPAQLLITSHVGIGVK